MSLFPSARLVHKEYPTQPKLACIQLFLIPVVGILDLSNISNKIFLKIDLLGLKY